MKVCVTVAALLLALLTPSAYAAKVNEKLEVGGYLQGRYESFEDAEDGSSTVNGFVLRRARLGILGKPSDRVLVKLELAGDNGSSTSVKDAYLRYFLQPGWTGASVTFGQFKYPFGLEIQESSRDRLAPERAQWVAFLFPDTRDKGLMVMTQDGKPLKLFLAVFNGNLGAKDNNNAKDFVGRVELCPIEGLCLGGSVYLGDQYISSSAGSRNKRRVGGDVKMCLGELTLTGEFVDARSMGANIQAWMAQGALTLSKRNILVCRVDRLDEGLTFYGTRRSYNVGLVHDVCKGLRGKLFYEFNREKGTEIKNDVLRAEVIANF